MHKKILLTILLIFFITPNAFADNISNWALNSFNSLSAGGILSSDVIKNNMQESITRKEFCTLIMNLYKNEHKVSLSINDMKVFDDTDDISILEAYKVGIVSGKSDKIFEPDSFITRQEMAIMISRVLNKISKDYIKYQNQITKYNNTFSDSNLTSSWAISDIAAICDYKIITGNDLNQVEPLMFATREQAICMLDRAYENFVSSTTTHSYPTLTSINKSDLFNKNLKLSWNPVVLARNYNLIVKIPDSKTIVFNYNQDVTSVDETLNIPNDITNCTIILGVKKADGTEVFSRPLSITKSKNTSTTTDVEKLEQQYNTALKEFDDKNNQTDTESVDTPKIIPEGAILATTKKEQRVFPNGYYFTTKEEALEHIVQVEIPVWHLNSDGTKSPSKKYLDVNKALAQDVIDIFTKIYNDPSQFPIKDIGGFYWRNTSGGRISHHSYGLCIDINYDENYYVEPDGTPITGTLWAPGENPYSIAPDSVVVKTFAEYDWLWGGTAWSDKYAKDYMHFTYLGK